MTISVALAIFNKELGEGYIHTVHTPLTNVPLYNQNLIKFRKDIKTVFDIRIPEDKIPISRFLTVGDLLDWCIKRAYLIEDSLHSKIEEDTFESNFLGKPMLNIIITGKSGAGKSSFLNYLIDKELFKTGEGAPVTYKYFEDFIYTSPDTGIVYHLFDTKGIEPTTTTECQQQVIGEIHKKDKSNDIYQWIHTVYYCFDASSKRIQPFEISFIKKLMEKASVVILLTKKDLVKESELAELKAQITKEIGTNIQVVAVCSVAKQTRKGISIRSGKEDALKGSFLGLWEKLANTQPQKQISFLTKPYKMFPLSLQGVIRFKEKFDYLLKDYREEFEAEFKKGAQKSFTNLSLDYLTDYPTLTEILCETLNEDDRKDIKHLLTATHYFLEYLSYTLSHLNVEKLWSQNEDKHEQIFSFYRKLNKEKPHVFHSHQSKNALIKLKEYGTSESFREVETYSIKTEKALNEIENCFWSTKHEKEYAREVYNDYRDKVKQLSNEIKMLANNFIAAYQSELHQYGQCCLRKDDFENMGQQDSVFSEEDMSVNEKSYYSTLQEFLRDHKITSAERSLLDSMRKSLGISPIRAGLIEDFIRNNSFNN